MVAANWCKDNIILCGKDKNSSVLKRFVVVNQSVGQQLVIVFKGQNTEVVVIVPEGYVGHCGQQLCKYTSIA